jgi:hypothetical protein
MKPDQYFMTVDLRVPNASTKPTAWPMPKPQDELHDLGVRSYPKNMEALQTMREPQNGAKLVQFVAAVNWM